MNVCAISQIVKGEALSAPQRKKGSQEKKSTLEVVPPIVPIPIKTLHKDLHDTYFVPTYKSNLTLFAFLQAQTESEVIYTPGLEWTQEVYIYNSSAYTVCSLIFRQSKKQFKVGK